MIRGTTPTITMKLPNDVSIGNVESATISIEQSGKEKITKTLPGDITKESGNTLAVKLTEKDTLSLSAKSQAFVQLKVKTNNNNVLASFPIPIVITDIINEKPMVDDNEEVM